MEYYQGLDESLFDAWPTSHDFGFPLSFQQVEVEQGPYGSSPYSAGDAGGCCITASMGNLAQPEAFSPNNGGVGDFTRPAASGPNDDDNAGLPPPVSYIAGGIISSTVGDTGIEQHGFSPSIADLVALRSSPVLTSAQPEVAAGSLTQLPHSRRIRYQYGYGVDGSGELNNSLDMMNAAGAAGLGRTRTQPAATNDTATGNPRETASSVVSILQDVRDRWAGFSERQKREYPVVVDILAAMKDPWHSITDHPEGFVTKASNTETRGGYWKERHFTAIRGRPDPEQQQQHPHYVGAHKTYEFQRHKPHNGDSRTTTKWLMHEYHLLYPHGDHPGLILDEDGLVFRRIIQIATDDHEAGVSQEYQSPPKRRRSSAPNGESEVWQHFTKIYSKTGKLAYAACHDCDRIFGAQPKNGTSSLIRHNEKHRTCSQDQARDAYHRLGIRMMRRKCKYWLPWI